MAEEDSILKWPSLYYHDIAKYLDHLTPDFLCKLDSEYKLGKAYRYFSCDYVRKIFYFDLDGDLCVMKSHVVPSQRVNNKPYEVWIVIRKDIVDIPGGEIYAAYCTCTAGLQGSCNHIVGMLFRIEAAVATGATRPSKTSMACQWTIPSGKKLTLKATKAEELYFSKTKYTKSNKTNVEKQKLAKKQFNAYKPSLHQKHLSDFKNVHEIREKLFTIIGPDIKNSSLAEVMHGKRMSLKTVDQNISPHPLTSMVAKLMNHKPTDILMHLSISQEECTAIEIATRSQSTNPLWYEHRKGRITASKFYRVCTRADSTLANKNLDAKNLVNEIMGNNNRIQTLAMKHGLAMEPHARKKLIEVFKEQKHKHVNGDEVGLIISPYYPHLGATPDLILNCSCHDKFIVEIKCPDSIKNTAPSVNNLNYLVCDDGVVKLKERHSYYFQVQGQMAITKIDEAIFFVYTHHGYFIQFIKFDPELWIQMLSKFNYFWSKHVVTEIVKTQCVVDKINETSNVTMLTPNKENAVEDVCGICTTVSKSKPKSPTEYSISCESCQQWFHITCAGVTEEEFNDKNFAWICTFCSPVDFSIQTLSLS